MKVLELFCGSKSFTKEAEKLGFECFTSDVNKTFKPDYLVNILNFDVSRVPFKPNIIWASPPCTWFSVASAWKHWNKKDKTPKTIFAQCGIEIVRKTIEIIDYFKPEVWYIENPRGMLRHQDFMDAYLRRTVTYCQYSDDRMKPTDIWTNNKLWIPRKMCEVTDTCHKSEATNKLNTPAQRATIPAALCREILLSSQAKIEPLHEKTMIFYPQL
jgi:site-specific DNA-cytosine methylase